MPALPPTLISIDRDEYSARHIGRTQDGRQFFLTTPFVPVLKCPGSEYIAPYLFDDEGRLLEARIDDFGPRASLDKEKYEELDLRRLEELGPVEFCRIEVQPFHVERFGTTFGFILREPEDDDGVWCVEVKPVMERGSDSMHG